MRLVYRIDGDNFDMAGEASSSIKKTLVQLGVSPADVKRAVVSMYEAEMNAFLHGGGGEAEVQIDGSRIDITIRDFGAGIRDLDLAMQEGWSTANEQVRKLGFGAGMGLPNMKKNTDALEISTGVGKGTEVRMIVNLSHGKGELR